MIMNRKYGSNAVLNWIIQRNISNKTWERYSNVFLEWILDKNVKINRFYDTCHTKMFLKDFSACAVACHFFAEKNFSCRNRVLADMTLALHTLTWASCWVFRENTFKHPGQLNATFLTWSFSCNLSWSDRENALLHRLQRYGFSPVCVRSCLPTS